MKVLLTPLDWGLGHATRLCPVIDFVSSRHEVMIAASGRGFYFLSERYPHLKVMRVPALELRYARSSKFFAVGLVVIGLKLMINYLIDRVWVARAVRRYGIDIIISDSRLGMYEPKAKNYFIAHQLWPIFPRQLNRVSTTAERIYHRILQNFNTCLVPDNETLEKSLAGILSRPIKKVNVQYLGPLSRFLGAQCNGDNSYDIIALISGIEPHRQILIDMITKQLLNSEQKVMVVSGRPDRKFDYTKNNIRFVSHLEDSELCKYIRGAKIVVARGGYSTIMDLMALGKSGIIIPTPGQTEQEYLTQWLTQQGMFYSVEQEKLKLSRDIDNFLFMKDKLQDNVLRLMQDFSNFISTLEQLGL